MGRSVARQPGGTSWPRNAEERCRLSCLTASLRAYLSHVPGDVEAAYRLGLALDRLGLREEAVAAWTEAVRIKRSATAPGDGHRRGQLGDPLERPQSDAVPGAVPPLAELA